MPGRYRRGLLPSDRWTDDCHSEHQPKAAKGEAGSKGVSLLVHSYPQRRGRADSETRRLALAARFILVYFSAFTRLCSILWDETPRGRDGSMIRLRILGRAAMAAAAMAAIVTAPAALAHHAFSQFDKSREAVLDGTVREFRWTNPHCWIQLRVIENGQPVEYSIESPSPSFLSRRGWSNASFKPGERVKITINPLRDGSKGGAFVRGVLANGQTLTLAN